MKVEVELEDLETIVFATAIIKTIEGALQQRKQDPFVRPHLNFKIAHDNLVNAMNSARRSENTGTVIAWDGELDLLEINLLADFVKTLNKGNEIKIDAEYRMKHEEVDSLLSKGCIRMGQGVVGVVWPGAEKADIKPIPFYLIDMTQRGRDKLAQALKIKNEAKS